MNLIHKSYIDSVTGRLVMTADPLELAASVTSNSNSFVLPQASTSSGAVNTTSPVFSPFILDHNDQPALFERFSGENSIEMLNYDLPKTSNVHTYIPPTVVPFSGDSLLLVIDVTKVPGLDTKRYNDLQRALVETPPLSVVINTTDDMVNKENTNPQAVQHPSSINKRSKRKAKTQKEEEDDDDWNNYGMAGPSTKRRKSVLRSQSENKKTAEKASGSSSKKKTAASSRSGSDEKPFECPQCGHSSKRRFNLNAHMKTHESNRIKEFVCPQCNKDFTRKHDRDRHVASVHK